jgi:hypothetical protein
MEYFDWKIDLSSTANRLFFGEKVARNRFCRKLKRNKLKLKLKVTIETAAGCCKCKGYYILKKMH